jgi:hypothetical protein
MPAGSSTVRGISRAKTEWYRLTSVTNSIRKIFIPALTSRYGNSLPPDDPLLVHGGKRPLPPCDKLLIASSLLMPDSISSHLEFATALSSPIGKYNGRRREVVRDANTGRGR